MFGWLRRKGTLAPKKAEPEFEPEAAGEIGYHGLSDWWMYEFTDDERRLIRETYQPLGSSGYAIDRGSFSFTSQSPLSFVSTLATWFNKQETRHIAYKFLRKADEYFDADAPVLNRHFAMQARCEAFYRWRDHDEGALQEAINSCERGIALSQEAAEAFRTSWNLVPSHHCFKQLAIIEEKRGNLDRALALSRQAKADGWAGDWTDRIARLKRKKAKAK